MVAENLLDGKILKKMFEVILLKPAQKFYEQTSKIVKNKLDRCFETLSSNPYKHNNIKILKGILTGYLRFRVGDYRVIYRIVSKEKLVIVSIIASRSKVYK